MECFSYLCFFTLIVFTYAIPAESEYILVFLLSILEIYFTTIIISSILRHSFRIQIDPDTYQKTYYVRIQFIVGVVVLKDR